MQRENRSKEFHLKKEGRSEDAREIKLDGPFPIFLKDFKEKQYLPTFDYEVQVQNLVKDQVKHRNKFQKSKCKAILNQTAQNDVMVLAPIPKYKECQVCREEFEDYQKHVDSPQHLRFLRDSQGQHFIEELVQNYDLAKDDENYIEQITFLKKMNNSLRDISIFFEKELQSYNQQMINYKKQLR